MQKKYNVFRITKEDIGIEQHTNEIHAEMDALHRARHLDLHKASIYVYREDKNGDIAMCKPCGACMRAIEDAGIQNIYYTTPEGYVHLELKK